jgi:anion-transporting  ArsA/GET3 family ATPase
MSATSSEHASTNESELVQKCVQSKIVVCCGTGGVGKTSVAAALAVICAQHGRRAVVVTIDPARRLVDAMGLTEKVGNEPTRVDLDAPGEMWVTMLNVRETFDGLVREVAPTPQRADEVISNSFYKNIAESISGTRDYMAAARLYSLHHDERFDVVIVDTPPTRNALDFLDAPERLARFLNHPIVRFLSTPARGGFKVVSFALTPVVKIIGRVVGSDALESAISFLRAFDGMQDVLRDRALAVAELLRADHTAFTVVAAPQKESLDEAQFFIAELKRLSLPLRILIANRMPPRFGNLSTEEALQRSRDAGPLADAYANLAVLSHEADIADATIDTFISPYAGQIVISRAHERADDIHDMGGIVQLASELAS